MLHILPFSSKILLYFSFQFIALVMKTNMGWRANIDLPQSSWIWLQVWYGLILAVQAASTDLLNISVTWWCQILILTWVRLHLETRWGGGWSEISWSAPIRYKYIKRRLWKSSFIHENSSIMGGNSFPFLFLLIITCFPGCLLFVTIMDACYCYFHLWTTV